MSSGDNLAHPVLEYTLNELEHHAFQEIGSRLPLEYIQTLPHDDKIDALRAGAARAACLIVYRLTTCTIAPRVFQLQSSLAMLNRRETFITAGTGSGKMLCQLIPMLLRPNSLDDDNTSGVGSWVGCSECGEGCMTTLSFPGIQNNTLEELHEGHKQNVIVGCSHPGREQSSTAKKYDKLSDWLMEPR